VSIGNSPPEDRPSVGRALAQARLAAGLSVDEVSTTTRVRVPILQAIEQDDFSGCGGDVYARGHIRALARALGLDPEPLVEQYGTEHGHPDAPVVVAPVYEAQRVRAEPSRPNWTAAMIFAIVVVVGVIGFTVFSGGGDKSTATSPTASPTSTPRPSQTPQSNDVPRPQPSSSAIAAAPPDKVTVKVSVEGGTSWIQATDANGKQLFQDSLHQGESRTWTDDKKIRLIVGNAGAVRLFVNGKDLGPAGSDGQVVRLTYTPGDPTQG